MVYWFKQTCSDNIMSTTFSVKGKLFTFANEKIPKNSLLDYMKNDFVGKSTENAIPLDEVKEDDMRLIYRHIMFDEPIGCDNISVADYFNLELNSSYELSLLHEEYMRKYMYMPGYENDFINTDNLYGLIPISELQWDKLLIERQEDRNLLFSHLQLKTAKWKDALDRLKEFNELFGVVKSKMLIAGGAVFSCLFGLPINDIDIFFYGSDVDTATQDIKSLSNYLGFGNKNTSVVRTENAFSITRSQNRINKTYQVILRLYRTLSEILHGFDVDCSSIGYDGKNILMTRRAYYAITHGYNTVNFGRLSPSYEFRLAKYGTKGMAIKVPQFSKDKINLSAFNDFYKNFIHLRCISKCSRTYYKAFKGKPYMSYGFDDTPKGLDLLIALETHCINSKWNVKTMKSISKLAEESSDYGHLPYAKYPSNGCGSNVYDLLRLQFNAKKSIMNSFENTHQSNLSKLASCLRVNSSIMTNKGKEEHKFGFIGSCGLTMQFNLISPYVSNGFPSLTRDEVYESIVHIPDYIYDTLSEMGEWKIKKQMSFIQTNPGQQMTGTFHKIVIDDKSKWYNGKFYTLD